MTESWAKFQKGYTTMSVESYLEGTWVHGPLEAVEEAGLGALGYNGRRAGGREDLIGRQRGQ